jgi:hypothetical protein
MLQPVAFIVVAAFIVTIVAAMGKAPLWVAVLLVTVAQLLMVLGPR